MGLTATEAIDNIGPLGNMEKFQDRWYFRAKAGVNYPKNSLVTSNGFGLATIETSNDVEVHGVVMQDTDNTTGTDGALRVPVILRGPVLQDFICSESGGQFADQLRMGKQCGIKGDGGVNGADGQTICADPNLVNKQFASLGIHNLPDSGIEVKKALFFFRGSSLLF